MGTSFKLINRISIFIRAHVPRTKESFVLDNNTLNYNFITIFLQMISTFLDLVLKKLISAKNFWS